MAEGFDKGSIVRYLIGAAQVKFEVLDRCLPAVTSDCDTVIFHLDADAILYRLYRKRDLSIIYSVPTEVAIKDIVVNLANVVGHYRRYCITRLRKRCIVYLYYNDIAPLYQNTLCPGYRHSWYDMFDERHVEYGPLFKTISKAMPFVTSILQYTTGNYVIENRGVDNPTAINYFIRKISDIAKQDHRWASVRHVIVSRSIVTMQLLNNDIVQLYSKRDKSYVITADTAYAKGVFAAVKSKGPEFLRPPAIPYLIMLGGFKELDIEPTTHAHGISRAAVLVGRAIKHEREQYSPELVLNNLAQVVKNPDQFQKDREMLTARYNAVRLSSAIYAVTKTIRIRMDGSIVDLYDQNALEEINNLLSKINVNGNLLEITNLNLSRT